VFQPRHLSIPSQSSAEDKADEQNVLIQTDIDNTIGRGLAITCSTLRSWLWSHTVSGGSTSCEAPPGSNISSPNPNSHPIPSTTPNRNQNDTVIISSGGHAPPPSSSTTNPAPDKSGTPRRSTHERGNQPSRPQASGGETFYTGRQHTYRQSQGRGDGGDKNDAQQNGGQQNDAGNQGGAPDGNGDGGEGPNRPNRNDRANRSRGSSQTTSTEDTGSSSNSSRNLRGYDGNETVDGNGTSRGLEPPGHPERDPPEDRDAGGDNLGRHYDPYDDNLDDMDFNTDVSFHISSRASIPRHDGSSYGSRSPISELTDTDPCSSESDISDDTSNGPAMSPLLPNFDVNLHHERNPPGAYDIVIGRWIQSNRYNGNRSRQNIVRPRIDAALRMTYQITTQDSQRRLAPMPSTADGRRVRRMATERSLRARLSPQEAQQGYFEYEPRYAAAGVNVRRLIDQDIAALRWAQRQQMQAADQARRQAAHLADIDEPQSREEFELRERADRRRTLRRATRRDGRNGRRRAIRRLNRQWARRRARYPQWFG